MISESLILACFSGLVAVLASIWAGYGYYRAKLDMSKPSHDRFVTSVIVGLSLIVIAWIILRLVFPAPIEEGGPPIDVDNLAGYVVGLISALLGLAIIFYYMIKVRRELALKHSFEHKKRGLNPSSHEL